LILLFYKIIHGYIENGRKTLNIITTNKIKGNKTTNHARFGETILQIIFKIHVQNKTYNIFTVKKR
jgi:hypothetical protein